MFAAASNGTNAFRKTPSQQIPSGPPSAKLESYYNAKEQSVSIAFILCDPLGGMIEWEPGAPPDSFFQGLTSN
jgi:hypothetical protein